MGSHQQPSAPPLYIWLGTDPLAAPPDVAIEDVPGISDLQLIADAIRSGRFGRMMPTKLAYSPHERPQPNGYRSVDVARLLRDYAIPYRARYELLLPDT